MDVRVAGGARHRVRRHPARSVHRISKDRVPRAPESAYDTRADGTRRKADFEVGRLAAGTLDVGCGLEHVDCERHAAFCVLLRVRLCGLVLVGLEHAAEGEQEVVERFHFRHRLPWELFDAVVETCEDAVDPHDGHVGAVLEHHRLIVAHVDEERGCLVIVVGDQSVGHQKPLRDLRRDERGQQEALEPLLLLHFQQILHCFLLVCEQVTRGQAQREHKQACRQHVVESKQQLVPPRILHVLPVEHVPRREQNVQVVPDHDRQVQRVPDQPVVVRERRRCAPQKHREERPQDRRLDVIFALKAPEQARRRDKKQHPRHDLGFPRAPVESQSEG
mmetsp:Transcript_60178/g.141689  ORF Transcript_60178/g.141689 Transcript_60178/m.141689 type:complete len:333 (+) Transcript_60178:315-1313(+)